MSSWKRPDIIPYPSVWHRFTAQTPDPTNPSATYRVQDVPEDRFEDCIQHMCSYFLRDEPTCRSLRIASDPAAVEEFSALWRMVLLQRCAVVCLRDDSDEIVGVNMLHVVSRNDSKTNGRIRCPPVKTVVDCTMYMTEKGNLFERYPAEECFLSAWGLSVHPRYRGLGLTKEILFTRIPLGQALGLKLSATVFSHPGSQIPASKVGFRDTVVEKFVDLAEKGFILPDINVEYNKLMVLEL